MNIQSSVESLEELACSYMHEAKIHYDQIQNIKNGKTKGIIKDSVEKREKLILECIFNHFAVMDQLEKLVEIDFDDDNGGDDHDLH